MCGLAVQTVGSSKLSTDKTLEHGTHVDHQHHKLYDQNQISLCNQAQVYVSITCLLHVTLRTACHVAHLGQRGSLLLPLLRAVRHVRLLIL